VLAVLMLGDDRTFIDLEIEESYIKLLEQEFLAYYVREPVKQPSSRLRFNTYRYVLIFYLIF
jgi:hypothetical protein